MPSSRAVRRASRTCRSRTRRASRARSCARRNRRRFRRRSRASPASSSRDLAPVARASARTSTGLTMGESAERMAGINGITREEQDRWALRSHTLAAQGTDDGRLGKEIVPVRRKGRVLSEDTHIRRDSTLERLGSLRPYSTERTERSLRATPARSPTARPRCCCCRRSERAPKGRTGLVAIRAYAYAAVDPADQLLHRARLRDTDRPGARGPDARRHRPHRDARSVRGAGPLDVPRAREPWLGADRRGSGQRDGRLDRARHPFAPRRARILTTLANEMRRRDAQFGLASVCAAGGNGAAIVLELLR